MNFVSNQSQANRRLKSLGPYRGRGRKKMFEIIFRYWLFFTLFLFGSAIASHSTIYYVDPNGSDSNPGTQSAPWKTPQKGASTAIAGDTVFFLDGTYTIVDGSTVRFSNKGTFGNPITYKSLNQYGAKIVASASVAAADAVFSIGTYSGNWVPYTPFHIVIDGFDISGGKNHNIQSAGGAYVEIKNCNLHDSGHDPIKMNSGADYAKIHDNLIHDSGYGCNPETTDCNADGIDVTSSYYVEIYNNEVYNIKSTGIYIKKGSHFGKIYNNYVHDIRNSGISLGESSPLYTSVAYNNLIVNTGQSGLSAFGCKDCQFYNNTVYNANTDAEVASAGMRMSAAENRSGAELLIAFTSGGPAELSDGDLVVGAISGDMGTVFGLALTSGTWADGDATGTFWIKEGNPDNNNLFQSGMENINATNVQDNILTTTGNAVIDDKYCRKMTFKNNIVVLGGANYRGFRVGAGQTLKDVTEDNNLYYSTYGSDAITFDAPNYIGKTLSQWRSATAAAGYPQSVNSKEDNPNFASVNSADSNYLFLTKDSPAVGSGTTTLYSTDYNGVARTVPFDLGAFKYGTSTTRVFESGASTTSPVINSISVN